MRKKLSLVILLLATFIPVQVFAASSGDLAWEGVLKKISDSVQGPVAYSVGIIAIVMSGIVMAFSDLQGGAKKFVQAACGLSIAFLATSIVTGFLNFSGAVI